MTTCNPEVFDMIKLAHFIKRVTECSDPVDLRNAVDEVHGEDDATIDIDGMEWRFIRADEIDEIQQEELKSDTYVLGCFFPSFLASILEVDEEIIEAAQANEGFDALGRSVIKSGKLEKLQKEYADADGYGHHFAHYDHETHEEDDLYAFRIR